MDEWTFDLKTALDWIASIEKSGPTARDTDIYPMLNEWIRDASPKTVLDIGCGQGICSDKINLKDRQYIGIDPSPFLLDRAKESFPLENRDFLLGNAYDLPVAPGDCDAAFSILVWHLLSNPRKAATELGRILIENGSFLIVTANPSSFEAWKAFYPDAQVNGARLEGTMQLGDASSHDVLYIHSLDEIHSSLLAANLQVTRTEPFRCAKGSTEVKLLIAIYGRKTTTRRPLEVNPTKGAPPS